MQLTVTKDRVFITLLVLLLGAIVWRLATVEYYLHSSVATSSDGQKVSRSQLLDVLLSKEFSKKAAPDVQ